MGKKDSKGSAAIKPDATPKKGGFTVTKAGMLARPRSIQLYGTPGSGKSTYGATICDVPGFNKVAMVDFDFGSSGVGADHPELDVYTFAKGDIRAFQKWWDKFLANDGEDYDAVILDTITKAQRWMKKDTVIKGSSDVRGQWGEVGDWTLDLVEELQSMRPLGIGIFHTEIGNALKGAAEGDEDYRYLPSLQGAAKMTVSASACVVGFCDTDEMDEDDEDYDEDQPLQYSVRVQPGDTTLTKNRFKLPPLLNADGGLPRLYELIEERQNTKKKG